jgi:hypothetical protein
MSTNSSALKPTIGSVSIKVGIFMVTSSNLKNEVGCEYILPNSRIDFNQKTRDSSNLIGGEPKFVCLAFTLEASQTNRFGTIPHNSSWLSLP